MIAARALCSHHIRNTVSLCFYGELMERLLLLLLLAVFVQMGVDMMHLWGGHRPHARPYFVHDKNRGDAGKPVVGFANAFTIAPDTCASRHFVGNKLCNDNCQILHRKSSLRRIVCVRYIEGGQGGRRNTPPRNGHQARARSSIPSLTKESFGRFSFGVVGAVRAQEIPLLTD